MYASDLMGVCSKPLCKPTSPNRRFPSGSFDRQFPQNVDTAGVMIRLLAPGDTRLWSGARWRNPDGGFAASFICRRTTLGRCRVVWLLLQPGWFARHTRVFAPNPPGVGMRDDLHALVGCMCGCTCRAADFTAHRGVCLCTSLGTLPRPTPARRGKAGKNNARLVCPCGV